jgi:hypothetical protein
LHKDFYNTLLVIPNNGQTFKDVLRATTSQDSDLDWSLIEPVPSSIPFFDRGKWKYENWGDTALPSEVELIPNGVTFYSGNYMEVILKKLSRKFPGLLFHYLATDTEQWLVKGTILDGVANLEFFYN